MPDILDELYDDFAQAVYYVTEKLRTDGSVFITNFDLDEALADGIAATVAAEFTVTKTSGGYYTSEQISGAIRNPAVGGRYSPYSHKVTWHDGSVITKEVPVVLACNMFDDVWYFYIERDEDD